MGALAKRSNPGFGTMFTTGFCEKTEAPNSRKTAQNSQEKNLVLRMVKLLGVGIGNFIVIEFDDEIRSKVRGSRKTLFQKQALNVPAGKFMGYSPSLLPLHPGFFYG